MLRIPGVLFVGFVAFGLSFATAPLALAESPPGFARTDMKIEPKDTKDIKASPADTPDLPTLRSLSAAHAVEVHPYVATPNTKETHTLQIKTK